MITKLKYVGNDETGLTLNNIYVVLGFDNSGVGSPKAIILNDSGIPYLTQVINNTARWVVESVEYPGGLVQVYP